MIDWCHLFRCPKSWAFVHQFGNNSDNWYKTKTDFCHRAKALNLTEKTKIQDFRLLSMVMLRKVILTVQATNHCITFTNLINVLEIKFNSYKSHPTKNEKR